jgi:hypothetical protein
MILRKNLGWIKWLMPANRYSADINTREIDWGVAINLLGIFSNEVNKNS